MTLFTESFDSYNGSSGTEGYQARWTLVDSGNNLPGLAAGRFGGQCWAVTTSYNSWMFSAPLGFDSADFSVSIAYQRNTAENLSAGMHFMLGNGATPTIGIRVGNDGSLNVSRNGHQTSNGTALYSGNVNDIPINAWDTIRIAGTIHSSAGTLEVWLGATQVYSATGLNTQGTGAATLNTAFMAINGVGNGLPKFSLDDIVVRDDDVLLPECRIQPLQPNADGGTLNLTPSTGTSHYAVVDEPTVSSADYLSGSADGEYDLLDCEDISVVPASILALKAVGFASKTDAASRAWNLGVVSNVTTDDGADLSLSNSIGYSEHQFELDPDTSLAWTQSGVNGAQLKPTVVVP